MKCQKCGTEFEGNFCPNCGTPAGTTYQTKFCKFCGEKIAFDAVVCTKCGRQVEQIQPNQPLVINNSASASAVNTEKRKKHYSLLLDLILICCTGGLWLIWMIFRPKYE